MMRTTNRYQRQARAITVRGEDSRPPAWRLLRVTIVSGVLVMLTSLSPDLLELPTQADEPVGAIVEVAARASQSVSPVRGVEPRLDPALPLAKPQLPAYLRPTVSAGVATQFQAALDAARVRADAFGVTFAVVRDGQLVWTGSSGVGRDGRSPMKPGSTMVIGSVTKTFVATAILQLVDEGRIALDDPVRTHLPQLSWISRDITVRMLLDHTSGLADVYNETTRVSLEQQPERSWTTAEIFATLHAPWYPPGEGWAYANTNYYLLGMILERVTGSSLEGELDRRFLTPLGLGATRTLTADEPNERLPAAWSSIFWASGAMSSSASDLARWGDALYDDDSPGDALLEEGTVRSMLTINDDDYGLGVRRLEVPPRIGYGHTGMLNTYTALILHLPDDDVTIAILVNRTEVDLRGVITERPSDGGPSLLRLAIDS
jgi:D-alanyl-D-alanine carboxypeptidase